MGINDAALANHCIADAKLMKFILQGFSEFDGAAVLVSSDWVSNWT